MSTYKGQPVTVERTGAEIAEKFSNLKEFEPVVENLPAEQREKLQGLSFETDAIAFDVNMVGRVKFRMRELSPDRVTMQSEGTPMPFTLSLDMKSLGDARTEVTPEADLDIPFMLKPMVGPHIQKAMDQIGGFLAKILNA